MYEKFMSLSKAILFLLFFDIFEYPINDGNYHKNQLFLIAFCMFYLLWGIWYYTKDKQIVMRLLTKKDSVYLITFLILTILFVHAWLYFFPLSSEASSAAREITAQGLTISFILDIVLFGPILEELTMRGLIQKGVFNHSWIGVLISSCCFSYLHIPSDFFSFVYYAMMGMFFGLSYKLSNNLAVSIVCHACFNASCFFF